MTHKQLTIKLVEWLLSRPGIDLAIDEISFAGGFVDAVGVSTRPKTVPHKILAIEAKVTKADLLQDLKSQKLIKYQSKATHCYLALLESIIDTSLEDLIIELTEKQLPTTWGILIVGSNIKVVRKATRINTVSIASIRALCIKIAKSSMYKYYRPLWKTNGKNPRKTKNKPKYSNKRKKRSIKRIYQ